MKILLLALLAASPAHAAKCYISEYGAVTQAPTNVAQIARQPTLADQVTADFASAAVASATFNAGTTIVRVFCDTQGSIVFGSSPVATNQNMPIAAGAVEYFGIGQNSGLKLSVHSNP